MAATLTQLDRIETNTLLTLAQVSALSSTLNGLSQAIKANQAALLAELANIEGLINGSPPPETGNFNPQDAVVSAIARLTGMAAAGKE